MKAKIFTFLISLVAFSLIMFMNFKFNPNYLTYMVKVTGKEKTQVKYLERVNSQMHLYDIALSNISYYTREQALQKIEHQKLLTSLVKHFENENTQESQLLKIKAQKIIAEHRSGQRDPNHGSVKEEVVFARL